MKKTMFLFVLSCMVLGFLIGGGIALWGNDNISNQEVMAAEELKARKDVVEVNSQLTNKQFTVSTLGKEYRIIRFTMDSESNSLETMTSNILKDKELIRILKRVGFYEVQISSTDGSLIIYLDLLEGKIGKRSNI